MMFVQPVAGDYQVIPDEAIRLRILAESDGAEDQALKHAVRDAVNLEITEWVEELTSVEAAREMIQSRLFQVEEIVAETIEKQGLALDFQVAHDENVSFPEIGRASCRGTGRSMEVDARLERVQEG